MLAPGRTAAPGIARATRVWQDGPVTPAAPPPSRPAARDHGSADAGIAWVDGRVVPAGEATVPLTDEGFLRGDAVFEAVLVRAGRTHALQAHLDRLARSAAAMDLPLPDVRGVVTDLLVAWGERDGALRVVVTRSGTLRGLLTEPTWPESLALAVVEAPWRTPLSGVKTLSYAVNQWAVRRARERDADDALIVDEGTLLELPTGALCLVHGERLSTPDPQRLPILDSVTVRALREVVAVEPAVPDLDDLRAADEVFVVSATRPVLAVHAVALADADLTLPAPGPVTARVRDAFERHIAATRDGLP